MSLLLIVLTLDWAAAITLSPFAIYFRKPSYLYNKRMVNHETIHWYQQLEMLIIFFYVWYLVEFFIRSVIWIFTLFSSKWKPYRNLSFERESYANDDNLIYLDTRKHFSWLKYIFHRDN